MNNVSYIKIGVFRRQNIEKYSFNFSSFGSSKIVATWKGADSVSCLKFSTFSFLYSLVLIYLGGGLLFFSFIVSYIKYLGIYLDEHLQWEPQIQHVNNKLAKNVGIINKLRHYLDFYMLKQLYYTLIYPYLNYGLASWGAAYKTRLQRICSKQNRCIRSMFFANGREHVNPYYNLLGILRFENIYRLKYHFLHINLRMTKVIPQLYY